MDAIEEEATLVGIDTVLSKPIPFDELKQALEHALNTSAPAPTQTPPSPEPAAPQQASFLKLMDTKVTNELLEMFTVDDLKGLVEKYVVDTSDRLEKIMQAIDAGDDTAMSLEAHSLKGSSSALGFADISNWAHCIERREPENDSTPFRETALKIPGSAG
ncbi:hypothetical protein GQR58_030236 [Nymphon striatum]|nr:hypothetical protein GQR58_030236 [Nymphon striatum]